MKRLKTAAIVVLTPILVALAVDLYPAVKVLASMDTQAIMGSLHEEKARMEADLASYAECNNLREPDIDERRGPLTAEARTCLMRAMEQVRTVNGTVILSIAATGWLKDHPDDQQFRHSAGIAIDRGHLALSRAWGDHLSMIQALQHARDSMWLIRLTDKSMPRETHNWWTLHENQLKTAAAEIAAVNANE